MTYSAHHRRPHRRSRVLAVVVTGGLTAAVLAAVPGTAYAVGTSTFESADGNLAFDGQAGKVHDWANVPGLRTALDIPDKKADNSLGQGSKDDLVNVTIGGGSIPDNKSDLTRFYVAQDSADGNQYLYLAWERSNVLGTANFSFELNQAAQPDLTRPGPAVLVRRAGDLLVLYDFAKGGRVPSIKISTWVTSGAPKSVCQANSSVPCWGKVKDLTQTLDAQGQPLADAAINGVTVTDPIAPDAPRPLAAAEFGELGINLTGAHVLNGCLGFSAASVRSRASAAFDSELKDLIAPFGINVAITYDPNDATADSADPAFSNAANPSLPDGAVAIRVDTGKGSLADVPADATTSSKTGEGTASSKHSALNVSVPDPTPGASGPLVTGDVLNEYSLSTVSGPESARADQLTTADVADVDLVHGTLTADAVTSVATASASPVGAATGTLGSGLANVYVDKDGNGLLMQPARVTVFDEPIGLSGAKFGNGSYVAFYEKATSSDAPPIGTPAGSNGTYEVSQRVTAVHVHITDLDPLSTGLQPIDVWVSKAYAHARYSGPLCVAPQRVSGNGALVDVDSIDGHTDPALGYVHIPATGGQDDATILSAAVASVVTAGVGTTHTGGGFDSTQASSSTSAQVADVCVQPSAAGCLVSAQLARSDATATATTSGRSATGSVTLTNLVVNGTPVPMPVDPNMVIGLLSGFVTVNEQTCDSASATVAGGCAAGPSAGITVVALHVVIPGVLDVKVSESHADATFV